MRGRLGVRGMRADEGSRQVSSEHTWHSGRTCFSAPARVLVTVTTPSDPGQLRFKRTRKPKPVAAFQRVFRGFCLGGGISDITWVILNESPKQRSAGSPPVGRAPSCTAMLGMLPGPAESQDSRGCPFSGRELRAFGAPSTHPNILRHPIGRHAGERAARSRSKYHPHRPATVQRPVQHSFFAPPRRSGTRDRHGVVADSWQYQIHALSSLKTESTNFDPTGSQLPLDAEGIDNRRPLWVIREEMRGLVLEHNGDGSRVALDHVGASKARTVVLPRFHECRDECRACHRHGGTSLSQGPPGGMTIFPEASSSFTRCPQKKACAKLYRGP